MFKFFISTHNSLRFHSTMIIFLNLNVFCKIQFIAIAVHIISSFFLLIVCFIMVLSVLVSMIVAIFS